MCPYIFSLNNASLQHFGMCMENKMFNIIVKAQGFDVKVWVFDTFVRIYAQPMARG